MSANRRGFPVWNRFAPNRSQAFAPTCLQVGLTGQNRPNRLDRAVWLPVVLLFLLFLGAVPALARDVPVTGWDIALDYGEHSRGDVFTDTLRFVDANGALLQASEVDPTCECLTAEVTESGTVAIHFEVLPEELDGPTEKLMYVFTRSPEFDLLRVRLSIDVLPGGGEIADESEFDSDLTGPSGETADSLEIGGENVADMVFFYSPGCRTCARIKEVTITNLKQAWGDRLRVHQVNVDERLGYARLQAVRDHYQIDHRVGSFVVVVGDTLLHTVNELYNRLDRAVARSLENDLDTYMALDVELDEAVEETRSVLRSFSFWTVAGAGLLDGLNPCAFATIVFFISLLSYAGSTKRQILIVGAGFTISVFAVYLLLGLGAFRALQALSVYRLVGEVIWWITVALLAVLVIFSLRDTVQYYRTGQTRDAFLQLPRGTKKRIHEAMKRGLKTRNLLLASIGIGVTVTLFEAACTGQVYLPAIVLMLNDPQMSQQAWVYLILYNLLFILPLLIVFALAYIGIGSSSFADWSKRNYGLTRIALTLLFGAFLAILLVEGFGF